MLINSVYVKEVCHRLPGYMVILNLLKNRLTWYYVNEYLQNTTEEQIKNLPLDRALNFDFGFRVAP